MHTMSSIAKKTDACACLFHCNQILQFALLVLSHNYWNLSSMTLLDFFSLLGRNPSSTTYTMGVKPIFDLTASATYFCRSLKSFLPLAST